MNQSRQLAQRFREVLLNGTFIANTNFKDQLTDSSRELVTARVGSLNTIAILAQHIHYYIYGVKQVLQGGPLEIRDTYSFDFPPITEQQQWDTFLSRLWADAGAFADLVEQLTEQQLQQAFVEEKYGSYLRNIDAMIEHCYYHLGQVVLIKKMLAEQA